MMETTTETVKDVIFEGTLHHFQGLIEMEQARTQGHDPSLRALSRVLPLGLYGPIRGDHSNASLYWLVTNGFHPFLNAYMTQNWDYSTSGPLGKLYLSPNITLDELDKKARSQKSTLAQILRTGELRVTELPNNRIRVIFNVSRFESPDIFWMWTQSIILEMERQRFNKYDQANSFAKNSDSYKKLRDLMQYHRHLGSRGARWPRMDTAETSHLIKNLGH